MIAFLWLTLGYCIYVTIVVILIVHYLKHVILWKRKPYLILIELMALIVYFIFLYAELPCFIVQTVVLIPILITVLRTTYMYQYLVSDNGVFKTFSKLLWRNNALNSYKCIVFMCVIIVIRNVISISSLYCTNPSYLKDPCILLIQNYQLYTFMSVPLYLTIIIQNVFLVKIYLNIAKEPNFMKTELCCTIISTTLCILILNIFIFRFNYNIIWNLFPLTIVSNFWTIWMPLWMISFETRPSLILQSRSYDLEDLRNVSRQCYCEENILFIEMYLAYRANPSEELYRHIIFLFIGENAPHELNIDENHKEAILQSAQGMDIIYNHIIELIQGNLVPYLLQ